MLHYEGWDFRTYWYADLTIPPNEPDQFVYHRFVPALPGQKPMRPVWRLFNGEFGTAYPSRRLTDRWQPSRYNEQNPEIVQTDAGWGGRMRCGLRERMFDGR